MYEKTIAVLLTIIFLSVLFTACSDANNVLETTTTTTKTTTTTITTTQPEIDREDVLPSEPSEMTFKMNSVGGIDVNWQHKYTGDKDIKYYTVTFHLYNSVGDEVYDEITNNAIKQVRVSGPVYPGDTLIVFTDALFYSQTCSKVQIDEIKFEYMDGTTAEFWYGWSNGVRY